MSSGETTEHKKQNTTGGESMAASSLATSSKKFSFWLSVETLFLPSLDAK